LPTDDSASFLPCPYLGCEVEWTVERERHATARHPDLLPEHRDRVAATLAEPDGVRRSLRFGSARLFSRWFSDLRQGKHVVVVVNRDPPPHVRYWIMTAYIATKLTPGEPEWTRT
jgi:hypothetical protein